MIIAATLFALLLVILLVAHFILNNIAHDLVRPERRVLQDYHKEKLQNPAAFGIQIQHFDALNGQAPTLLVTSNGQPSPKGQLLREQVLEKGISPPSQDSLSHPKATVILLHGRHGRKEDLLSVAERFCAIGFRCIIPDLPAHGDSPINDCHFGSSTFETQLPQKLFQELSTDQAWANEPVHLWGMSMGGSFANHALGQENAPWDSATILCSFDRLDHVTQHKAGKLINYLVSNKVESHGGTRPDQIRPIDHVKKSNLPILFAHSPEDKLIPEAIGKRLFQAYPTSHKTYLSVPNGGHGNILTTPMKIYAEMATFLLKHSKT